MYFSKLTKLRYLCHITRGACATQLAALGMYTSQQASAMPVPVCGGAVVSPLLSDQF